MICWTRLGLSPRIQSGQAFGLRPQGGVSRKEDAFVERDRRALAEPRQWYEVGAVAADRGPVALGVLDQFIGFGDPDRPAASFEPVVENDRGDLAALAGASAVAEKPATAEPHGTFGAFRGGRDEVVGVVDDVGPGEMAGMRLAGIDHALELRVRKDAGGEQARRQIRPVRGAGRGDRGHRARLHELGRVRPRVRDPDRLQRVAFVEARGQPRRTGRRPFAEMLWASGEGMAPSSLRTNPTGVPHATGE